MSNKAPEFPTSMTAADVSAFMTVLSKNVELLTTISSDLKVLGDIKVECASVKEILQHSVVDEIVDATIVDKQLDITNETSKLARIVTENNTNIKDVHATINAHLPKNSETLQFFKEKWKTFAIWVSVIVFLLGTFTVWKTQLLTRSDKAILEAIENYQKTLTQSPIYHFDQDGHAYVISRAGDTLWISTEKPK